MRAILMKEHKEVGPVQWDFYKFFHSEVVLLDADTTLVYRSFAGQSLYWISVQIRPNILRNLFELRS